MAAYILPHRIRRRVLRYVLCPSYLGYVDLFLSFVVEEHQMEECWRLEIAPHFSVANQNLQNHTGIFLSCLPIGKRRSLSTVRPDLDQSVAAPPGPPPLPDLPIGYTPVLS